MYFKNHSGPIHIKALKNWETSWQEDHPRRTTHIMPGGKDGDSNQIIRTINKRRQGKEGENF